jgi:predicted Zn-dependent peptidase
LFTVYAGTSAGHVEAVLEQVRAEIGKLLRDGVTQAEFQMAREQLKGSYILGLESPSSRMTNIGRNLLLLEHVRTEQEVLDSIASVTIEDVMRVASDILTQTNGASLVGRESETIPDAWLAG